MTDPHQVVAQLREDIRKLYGPKISHYANFEPRLNQLLAAVADMLAQVDVIGEDEPTEPYSLTELGNAARNDLRQEQRTKLDNIIKELRT